MLAPWGALGLSKDQVLVIGLGRGVGSPSSACSSEPICLSGAGTHCSEAGSSRVLLGLAVFWLAGSGCADTACRRDASVKVTR